MGSPVIFCGLIQTLRAWNLPIVASPDSLPSHIIWFSPWSFMPCTFMFLAQRLKLLCDRKSPKEAAPTPSEKLVSYGA